MADRTYRGLATFSPDRQPDSAEVVLTVWRVLVALFWLPGFVVQALRGRVYR